MTSINKRPGWDWAITYDCDDGDGPQVMKVFGAINIEAAIADALKPFSALPPPPHHTEGGEG